MIHVTRAQSQIWLKAASGATAMRSGFIITIIVNDDEYIHSEEIV